MSATRASRLIIRKMIRLYGVKIPRKQRIRTNVDGEFVYTYDVKEPILCQYTELTAPDEARERWGFHIEADYILTFLPGTEIYEGDLLSINSRWIEMQNVVERTTKGRVDYIEALGRIRG